MKERKDIIIYPFSRRRFIKALAATGVMTAIPWFSACKREGNSSHGSTAAALFDVLFPDDGNGPGARRTGATHYLEWLLNDENYDADIRRMIRRGLEQLDEYSRAHMSKPFRLLSQKSREEVIGQVLDLSWGESFLSRMEDVLIDALCIDPIYGTNLNESGWKWLHHLPGHPRADIATRYPKILNRKKEAILVTSLSDL